MVNREVIRGVPALLAVLRASEQARDVYQGRGGYWVTYGGGEVDAATVHEAVRLGKIAETFPGEGLEYWRLPALVRIAKKAG
jgi:hypothetical protein